MNITDSSLGDKLNKLIELMSKSNFVPASQVENPYKEFTRTIPANGMINIYYSFNYFRVLTAAVIAGLNFRFGKAGTETSVVGAGMGIQFPAVLDSLYITNTTGGALTITVGLGIGVFDDNRLNVSGDVSVINGTVAFLNRDRGTVITSPVDITLTTTVGTIAAANTNRKEIILTNLDTAITAYIGTSSVNGTTRSGKPLRPGETVVLATTAAISGITLSSTAIIAAISNDYQ